MQVLRSPSRKSWGPVDEAGTNDAAAARFLVSIRELRDLQSQLHRAADHCEAAYKNTATQKKMVVESTRKYVCDAVVTVVDHLGSVAASIESRLLGSGKVAETEQRINCLKQRILTCRQYALSADLAALRWEPELPRYLPHYVISPLALSDEKSNGVLSPHADAQPNAYESPPKGGHRPSRSIPLVLSRDAMSRPLNYYPASERGLLFISTSRAFGGPSIPSDSCDPSLGYRIQDERGYDGRKRKSGQGTNFLSFLRRSKRTA